MTHRQDARLYQCKALTDLWTGSVDPKAKDNGSHLVLTGLLGSIRWWFEVLVRGLGGAACDPTNTKCEGQNHCAACELFGCTGWARKFRFEVLGEDKKMQKDQITKNATFHFRFTPLRPVCDEEWALLDATLRLIADYGAIGGKTVYKPTDEDHRKGKIHHQDFGLIKILEPDASTMQMGMKAVNRFVTDEGWEKPAEKTKDADFRWASLQNFWCVNGKYLTRKKEGGSSFNRIIGRNESKRYDQNDDSWLAGYRPDSRSKDKEIKAESKKVFSFKNPARTFGFVRCLDDFNMMQERLKKAWKTDRYSFLEGKEIMTLLFAEKEKQP